MWAWVMKISSITDIKVLENIEKENTTKYENLLNQLRDNPTKWELRDLSISIILGLGIGISAKMSGILPMGISRLSLAVIAASVTFLVLGILYMIGIIFTDKRSETFAKAKEFSRISDQARIRISELEKKKLYIRNALLITSLMAFIPLAIILSEFKFP